MSIENASGRGIDPWQDSESDLPEREAAILQSVAEVSIRGRILKVGSGERTHPA